jgi:cytoskeletal protein RodZ
LDEIVMGGMVLETNISAILQSIKECVSWIGCLLGSSLVQRLECHCFGYSLSLLLFCFALLPCLLMSLVLIQNNEQQSSCTHNNTHCAPTQQTTNDNSQGRMATESLSNFDDTQSASKIREQLGDTKWMYNW